MPAVVAVAAEIAPPAAAAAPPTVLDTPPHTLARAARLGPSFFAASRMALVAEDKFTSLMARLLVVRALLRVSLARRASGSTRCLVGWRGPLRSSGPSFLRSRGEREQPVARGRPPQGQGRAARGPRAVRCRRLESARRSPGPWRLRHRAPRDGGGDGGARRSRCAGRSGIARRGRRDHGPRTRRNGGGRRRTLP